MFCTQVVSKCVKCHRCLTTQVVLTHFTLNLQIPLKLYRTAGRQAAVSATYLRTVSCLNFSTQATCNSLHLIFLESSEKVRTLKMQSVLREKTLSGLWQKNAAQCLKNVSQPCRQRFQVSACLQLTVVLEAASQTLIRAVEAWGVCDTGPLFSIFSKYVSQNHLEAPVRSLQLTMKPTETNKDPF